MMHATARAKVEGAQDVLVVGLTFKELEVLRKGPTGSHYTIYGRKSGLPVSVMIFAAETEAHMSHYIESLDCFGGYSSVQIDDDLKQ
jgi:hypothetical protein